MDWYREGVFKEKRFGCQASKMEQDRSEWRGFVRGECMERTPGDEPLTFMRCHSCGLPQLCEALEEWKSVRGRAYNVKGIKGKMLFFFSFLSYVSLLL